MWFKFLTLLQFFVWNFHNHSKLTLKEKNNISYDKKDLMSSFVKIYTTGSTCGVGTPHPSGAHGFTLLGIVLLDFYFSV